MKTELSLETLTTKRSIQNFRKINVSDYLEKMAPQGQKSECRLATTSCNDYEANWKGQEDRTTY